MGRDRVTGILFLAAALAATAAACSSTTIVESIADGGSPSYTNGDTDSSSSNPVVPDLDATLPDDTTTSPDAPRHETGSTDTGGGPMLDVFVPVEASPGPDGGTCPGAAPTKADLDTAGGWNPPNAINATACSQGDITTFSNNFTGAMTFDDLVRGLPTTCAQCILSRQTDTNWQFIVADSTGTQGFFNYGACYAVAPGGSAACGQAVQYDEFCLNVSCAACPSADFSSCTQATATQSACRANFGSYIQSGCGTNATTLQALDGDCGTAVNAVGVLCAGRLPDGGPAL